MRGFFRGALAAVLVAVVVSAPVGAQGGGWRRAVNMTAARIAPAVASLPNGNVLVAGGVGLATAEVYDVASERFVAVGRMSEMRAYATATALPDGTVLIAGGLARAARSTRRSCTTRPRGVLRAWRAG